MVRKFGQFFKKKNSDKNFALSFQKLGKFQGHENGHCYCVFRNETNVWHFFLNHKSNTQTFPVGFTYFFHREIFTTQ